MSKRVITTLALAGMLCISQYAFSAGFLLMEQSISSLGNAYAGVAAVAEDATTVFFNPAGMSRLCRQEIVIGANGIFPVAKFHNHHSIISPVLGNGPILGGNGRQAGREALVGNLYYVRPLPCNLTFGFGINAPFGLVTDYGGDWVGRYFATLSKLVTVNINPSLSYRISNCLSIGVGFSAQYAHADLRNKIDFGAILDAMFPGVGFEPQTLDGHAKLTGDSWGYGGNIGLLWEITPCSRVGLAYRSQVRQRIRGKIHLEVPAGFGLETVFVDGARARANITLPDMVSLSGFHQINTCWAILADITWTHWDLLKALVVHFDSPQPENITRLKWRNTWRYALGAHYRPPCWCNVLLRAGVAYDQTPIPSKKWRSPRIPDQDRIWLTYGFGYDFTQCLHLDFAYAHLFVRDPKVNKVSLVNNPNNPEFFQGGLRGNWRAFTDIISAQIVWNF